MFVIVLGLLIFILILVFLIQSVLYGRNTKSRRRSWQDSGSDLSILPLTAPQSDPQIPSDSVHEASYPDASVGIYATDNVDRSGSAGIIDYGTTDDSSGGLGSAMADAIGWSGDSSGTFDSGSSDFGGGSTSDGSSD